MKKKKKIPKKYSYIDFFMFSFRFRSIQFAERNFDDWINARFSNEIHAPILQNVCLSIFFFSAEISYTSICSTLVCINIQRPDQYR